MCASPVGRRSISCPPPLQQFECESARDAGIECAKTCQNLDLECVSQGCVSGCMCPPGTVSVRVNTAMDMAFLSRSSFVYINETEMKCISQAA